MKINQAMIESYARNLLGQVIAATAIVSNTSNLSLFNFGKHEWSLVANVLWGALVPVILRYVNKKDPAFGFVAQAATDEVTGKLKNVADKTTKKAAK
jgi:hypothetical protein